MDNMNKITITDIAKKCGVSIKTVSRVVNESPDVSDATRQKVLAIMKEEGYQVNLLARGLKGSRTNIIIVFTDRHQEEHLSTWHNIMLKYLFQFAKENSLKIVMSPSNSEKYLEDETDGFYLLSSGIADGAILLENVHNDKRVEYLEKENIPYVVFGEPEDSNIHAVSLDNYDVGFKGGSFLMEKKYNNIAFLIGEKKFLSTQLRMKGFEDAIRGHDVTYHIYTGVDTIDKAYKKALAILDELPIRA
ncbi:MAG: transcriptional regulator, LacI family [Anaerocolumna sp.]|nr:transcriptional regulator, LacI family [Anaerocolumna sp.]